LTVFGLGELGLNAFLRLPAVFASARLAFSFPFARSRGRPIEDCRAFVLLVSSVRAERSAHPAGMGTDGWMAMAQRAWSRCS
jgi:hypothetical protein